MLDKIRKETGSWGTRLLFAFLAVVFIFWMGGKGGKGEPWAAKVNGHRIPLQQFQDAVRRDVEQRRAQNPNRELDAEQQRFIRQSTFERLVEEELLVQDARRLGFVISPHEIKNYLVEGPYSRYFTDATGKPVDFDKYEEVLKRAGMTPTEFESRVERDLLKQRMSEFIQNSVKVTDAEILEQYQIENDKVNLDFVRIIPAALAGMVEITDAEVSSYVTDHAEDIEAFYHEHFEDRYLEPKKATIRRITVRKPRAPMGQEPDPEEVAKAKKTANEALAAAKENFVAAAAKYSEGPTWEKDPEPRTFMERQLEGPIAAKVFGMTVEEDPALVETSTSFVIVKVESFTEEKETPLDEVRTEIAKELLTDERMDAETEKFITEAKEKLAAGENLESVVTGTPLQVRPTGAFGRGREPAVLSGAPTGFMEAAFEAQPGTLILVDGQVPVMRDASVLAVVTEHTHPDLMEFDSKKDSVRFTVKLRKQNAAYRAWREDAEARATIKPNPGLGLETPS